MSAFLFVADPDPERRRVYLERARTRFAPEFPGLREGEVACADGALLWAMPAHQAPPSEGPDGLALLLGEARRVTDGASLGPADVGASWAGAGERVPESFDGYYACLVVDPEGTLRLGGDRLGLFPLYSWSSGDVFLASTSPEPFLHHPLFRMHIDLVGLAGILLTNGLVGTHTLCQGVRRLPAGALVLRPRGGPACIVEQAPLPFSLTHYSCTQEERVATADHTLRGVMERHAGGEDPLEMRLSGGLDSRVAAAYLRDRSPPPEAVTFGRDHDLDVRYARAVARALGFPHRVVGDDPSELPELACRLARWEHLAGGFSLLSRWSTARCAGPLAARVHIGLVFDAVVGPYGWVDTRRSDRAPFDQVVEQITAWGLKPDAVTTLLKSPDGHDAVLEALALLRRTYDAVPVDEPFHRAHALYLLHRQRFHVGAVAWPMSFVQTPVLPVLDQRLLTCFLGMPEEAVMGRRIELALLRRHGEDLARIPLASHAKEAWAPVPTRAERIVRRVRTLRHLRRRWLNRHGDPRRFTRVTDFGSADWCAVRREAEAGRDAWHEVFHADALRALLPPPDARVPVGSDIAEGASRRNLVGLLLWRRSY